LLREPEPLLAFPQCLFRRTLIAHIRIRAEPQVDDDIMLGEEADVSDVGRKAVSIDTV